jgi:hypothetical protein
MLNDWNWKKKYQFKKFIKIKKKQQLKGWGPIDKKKKLKEDEILRKPILKITSNEINSNQKNIDQIWKIKKIKRGCN